MKGVLTILTVVFTMGLAQAQYERYTYHDDQRTTIKELFQVIDTFSNILEGQYISYYINGNVESKGYFSNNETVGEWQFFYETGKLKMTGDLKTGSDDGYWTYYFENGHKSMEGEIIDKKREGLWKIYYESGKLKEEGSFVSNRREGTWTGYYEDGSRRVKTDYTYGKGKAMEYYATGEEKASGPKSGTTNVGLWRYFFKDGKLQAEGLYKNGSKTGDWKYYYNEGVLAARGSFEHDNPQGEWFYYHKNGGVSTKGVFIDGKKDGYWGLFDEQGKLTGETNYKQGKGMYEEFYPSGKLKVKGQVKDEKSQGLWKYYYETGELEGECNFVDGRGEYFGYYPDGTLQTKGIIEDGKRVGRWELYKNDGSLSGYYKPIYNQTAIAEAKLKEKKPYGVGEYRFKSRKFKYFDTRINEFQGVILQTNPFLSFLGRVPFGVEFYLQERLGHELEVEGVRNPFYTLDEDVARAEVFTRGYNLAFKQKFYNPDNKYGLWYFGHEIRFSNLSHFVNRATARVSATERKIEYSFILGYRLMQNTAAKGFTIDSFVSLGTGYRDFEVNNEVKSAFDELNMNKVPLTFNFGLNVGYTFSFGARGK